MPSTVLVTPVLNGVSQTQLAATVSRESFSFGATINGPTSICSGTAAYTIANTGGQTITWSLSNPSIGTITSQSNTGAAVSFSGNGAQTLRASVTNQCGQVGMVSYVINTGATTFTNTSAITGQTGICSSTAAYSISNTAGQTVSWSLSNPSIGTITSQSNTGATVSFAGNGAQTLNALITNSCGQTSTRSYLINTGATTFSSTAAITGLTTAICSGPRTFTLTNVLGGLTVFWSVSDTSIATLSGSTNTQTTVNFSGSGNLSLTAMITNLCGQSIFRTVTIYSSGPTLASLTCGPQSRDFCSGAPIFIPSNDLPILDLNDRVTAVFNGMTTTQANLNVNWEWRAINPLISVSNNGRLGRILMIGYGVTGFEVRARNACGWGPWYTFNFEIVAVSARQSNPLPLYTISPNPAKDVVNIDLKIKTDSKEKELALSGQLFDLLGILKSNIEIKNNKASFSVAGLKKGIYILKIYLDDKVENHQIAVE